MMNKRRAAEQATLRARLEFLAAEEAANKPHVCNGHDHTACANKVRKDFYDAPNGYDSDGRMTFKRITDTSSRACKHDRKKENPACAKAKCPRIEQ